MNMIQKDGIKAREKALTESGVDKNRSEYDSVPDLKILPKQERKFTLGPIFYFDWSTDNRLICSRLFKTRDVVLIRNFR